MMRLPHFKSLQSILFGAALLCLLPHDAHAVCSNNEDGNPGQDGEIEYFTADNTLKYCDNTNWIPMIKPCPVGATSCGGDPDERVVFVSQMYTSAAGGIAGNDMLCQSTAEAAGLKGTYFAWISDNTSDPASRFEQPTVPYTTVNGIKIADNWTDLTDGTLDAGINRRENNTAPVSGNAVLTNTNTDGTVADTATAAHCANYSSSSGAFAVNRGRRGQTAGTWTINDNFGNCSNSSRRYCFEQDPLKIGLLGHWELNETSGTAAIDSSINGNDGLYDGGSDPSLHSEDAIFGTGINFDTVNIRRVTVPTIPEYAAANAITLSAWVRHDNTAGFQGIIDVRGVGHMNLRFNARTLVFNADAWSGGKGTWVTSTNVIPLEAWTHVSVTYNYSDPIGTAPLIYINSELQTLDTPIFNPSGTYTPPASSEILIGNADISGISRNFHGVVDDARVYDRALSASEIEDLYDQGKNRASLIGHWKLDETTGTTAADSSLTNLDMAGTNINFATDAVIGRVDGALDTNQGDGTSLNATSPVLYQNLEDFTVASWVNVDQALGENAILNIEDLFSIQQRFSGSQIQVQMQAWSGTNGVWLTSPSIDLNKWVHVATSYDFTDPIGTAPTIYINGEAVTASPVFTPTGTYSPTVATGARLAGNINSSAAQLRGFIDDTRLYTRVLDPAEVYLLANCTGPGTYYYNYFDDAMQWCDAALSYYNMGPPASGAGGCTSPAASEGALNYDTDRYKFCDGNGWVDIGK